VEIVAGAAGRQQMVEHVDQAGEGVGDDSDDDDRAKSLHEGVAVSGRRG
jgi:hypothetical protein